MSKERKTKWIIETSKKFPNYLENLDSRALNRFYELVKDLEVSDNPRKFSKPKQTKKHGVCYIIHIDQPNMLGFRIHSNILELVVVGDHKTVYGKG